MNEVRLKENPLITPADVKPHATGFEVIGTFNAGMARYGEEVIMLLRVAERPQSPNPHVVYAAVVNGDTGRLELVSLDCRDPEYDYSDPRVIRKRGCAKPSYLTSFSYLLVARSRDGRHFSPDERPLLFPQTNDEAFGLEDPRITCVDQVYYITYSAVSPFGVGVKLASTVDFREVQRHGMILAPENKDAVLFPEKIGGKYYLLHRPVPAGIGAPEIWLAESADLIHWGNHRRVMGLRQNNWDSCRIGAGAVPIKTCKGWLVLYHGADDVDRYSMGAVLLDEEHPWKVIARSESPLLEPAAWYETEGFFGNVVFSCGALVEGERVKMYYGAADTVMACAEIKLQEILDSLTVHRN